MIQPRNILRQIVDVQVQADRLIKRKATLNEIEDFAKYSFELRTYLMENIENDFILKQINEIPILNLEKENKVPEGFLYSLLLFFGGWLSAYALEQKKKSEALEVIRDIRAKYASTEFMLKNYFR